MIAPKTTAVAMMTKPGDRMSSIAWRLSMAMPIPADRGTVKVPWAKSYHLTAEYSIRWGRIPEILQIATEMTVQA